MKTIKRIAYNMILSALYRIIENVDGEKNPIKLISNKTALRIKVFCLWNLIDS